MKTILSVLCILLSVTPFAHSASQVYLESVGNGSAVLVIDGYEVRLREGQDQDDVLLVEAGDRYALLEINGLRQRLSVNSQIRVRASYTETSNEPVVIKAKKDGHHWVNGKINGKPVNFLVDTGASSISMNQSTAKRLGIAFQNGKRVRSNTANGVVEARAVTVKRVAIGDIVQRNVAASVLPDGSLSVVLLGNSFLGRVNMRVNNGVMTLEPR